MPLRLNEGDFSFDPATQVELDAAKKKVDDLFVNVKDFGVKSDGISDDTAAFQRALDSISTTGGSLFIPIGVTRVTSLTIPKQISLIGAGFSSVVKVSGTITTAPELDKKLVVRDLKLILQGVGPLLSVTKTWSGSASSTFLIDNCWFNSEDGKGTLLDVYGARESGITNCWFTSDNKTNSLTDGLRFRADALGGAMNIHVTGCQFHHLKTAIAGVGDSNNHQFLAGLRLINNMMISVYEGYKIEHGDYVLIEQSMLDFVDKPLYVNRVANLKIRNNYFAARNDGNDCVVVENNKVGYQMQWLDIANNRIFSYATVKGNGIVINSSQGDIAYGNITNNDMDLLNTAIQVKGLNSGRTMNMKIENNRSRSLATFIEVGQGAENNDFEGNYAEISVTTFISNLNPTGGNRFNLGNRYGTKRSSNKGKIITNGDGTTLQFSASHNLFSQASHCLVAVGTSALRNIPFHVTYDADKIYVNFLTAPPAGTNNVVINWEAEI